MEYRNAKHIGKNRIDCEINHPTYGWLPFTCDPEDTGAQFDVVELYDRMKSDPDTAAYIPPTQAELDAETARNVRSQRDFILATQVDSLVSNPLRWNDFTSDQKKAWADYRRALLDITQQSGFPNDVVWPTAP